MRLDAEQKARYAAALPEMTDAQLEDALEEFSNQPSRHSSHATCFPGGISYQGWIVTLSGMLCPFLKRACRSERRRHVVDEHFAELRRMPSARSLSLAQQFARAETVKGI
jgi:hypothetical protein